MISPLTVLVFGAAVVGSALTAVALRVRRVPGTRWFALLMAGVTLWAGAVGMQLVADTTVATRFWYTVKYLGVGLTVTSWFAFALSYAGVSERLPTWSVAALVVEPVALLVLAATNARHERLWSATSVVTVDGFSVVESTYGPLFWVHAVYSYVLLGGGTLVLLWTFYRRDLYRRQVAALLVGLALPWVANVLHLVDASPTAPVDPTPIAFVGTGLSFAVAVGRLRFLDTMPVVRELARDAALEGMTAGAIILDSHGYVVDANAAAVGLLGRSRESLLGEPFDSVLPEVGIDVGAGADAGAGASPDAGAYDRVGEGTRIGEGTRSVRGDGGVDTSAVGGRVVNVDVGGRRRHLRVESSPVNAYGGRAIGRLVTLRDVTEQLIREQRLEVQNRVLRHTVRNDMNVVLGHLDRLATDLDDPAHRRAAEVSREKGAHVVDQSEKARNVERLLTSSRVRDLDLDDLVGAAVADCRVTHPDASVTTAVPPGTYVRADESLPEALRELVENALSHGEGPVAVAATVDDDTDVVTVEVRDEGPGIPPHERTVLTAGRETALEHSNGLGLWLVKWAVSRSGGSLDIRDAGSRGCVVSLSVPRA
ncbi:histidine kinase N-terminal 7TM domain-containing protein [Halobium salinum]|uniref:histidine kinase n=1 Tax=Halobium salinum TaxID=1364940 RepID=A0ABD5P8D9_9EURY|nr:histidine kinase N-terminal 7TM domain-containing protein [Halobium salinum]